MSNSSFHYQKRQAQRSQRGPSKDTRDFFAVPPPVPARRADVYCSSDIQNSCNGSTIQAHGANHISNVIAAIEEESERPSLLWGLLYLIV